jgi:hypothetical protein
LSSAGERGSGPAAALPFPLRRAAALVWPGRPLSGSGSKSARREGLGGLRIRWRTRADAKPLPGRVNERQSGPCAREAGPQGSPGRRREQREAEGEFAGRRGQGLRKPFLRLGGRGPPALDGSPGFRICRGVFPSFCRVARGVFSPGRAGRRKGRPATLPDAVRRGQSRTLGLRPLSRRPRGPPPARLGIFRPGRKREAAREGAHDGEGQGQAG